MDHEAAVQWTRRSGFARRWEETSLPGGCIGSGLGGDRREAPQLCCYHRHRLHWKWRGTFSASI